MKQSQIWEMEDPARKEYIADWFADSFNVKRSDSLENFDNKIDRVRFGSQNALQKDALMYLDGEKDQFNLKQDLLKRIHKQQRNDFQETIRSTPSSEFKRLKGKNYRVFDKTTIGFVGGEKVKTKAERYLSNGEVKFRLRDKNGRFASYTIK